MGSKRYHAVVFGEGDGGVQERKHGLTLMDRLTPWSANIVNLTSLFGEWERRRLDGCKWDRKFREIYSVCLFTLCIENGSDKRYLIGFQQIGIDKTPVTLNQLFDPNFGEVEDCDVILVDDPKKYGSAEVPHHRLQLVSYINQPSTSEKDLVEFLERKKLNVAHDGDLRLVIHVEQEGLFNYAFLHAYLKHRQPACPYNQVFAFGQNAESPRGWFCVQVFPELAIFPELGEEDARKLCVDREQYSKQISSGE
jgi:hypothetical protein